MKNPPSKQKRRSFARPLGVELLELRTLLSVAPIDTLAVQFSPGSRAAGLIRQLQSEGASVRATSIPDLLEVRGGGGGLGGLMGQLAARPDVRYAEPVRTVRLAATPNDPRVLDGTLWGLTGPNGIQAPRAWDTTTGSTGVIIADIDTGVDYNHPDLYKNIWINQAEIPAGRRANLQDVDGDGLITFRDLASPIDQGVGKITDVNGDGRIDAADILAPWKADGTGGWADGISQDGDSAHVDDLIGWNFVANTNNPLDDHGHGTHTTGTLAGVGDDGTGIAGVNWIAQVMALKFLDASGSGTDLAAAQAIRYAADHGARASNNSWGGSDGGTLLSDAISYAGTKGQVFVAAAGNSATNTDGVPFYPASYNLANIISVAATQADGTLAGFSNYGATSVDLGAPGTSIYSTLPGGYGYLSGTSMAAPHVAGTAALVLSAFPSWSASQVISRILSTTTPAPALAGRTVSGGILNAAEAVAGAVQPTTDLGWVGGLGIPTNATTGETFTVDRAYSVGPVAAQNNFTIAYYASANVTFGDADDLLVGRETISAAADRAPGTHPGSSSPLRINQAGSYRIFARLDDGDVVAETDEGNNVGQSTQTIAVDGPPIVDEVDPGYAESGSWSGLDAFGSGYGSNYRYAASGDGTSTATWEFSGLSSGSYEVEVTWTAHANRASDAPYRVYEGTTLLGTTRLDQRSWPTGASVGGVSFQNLGRFRLSGTGALRVVLGNDADGYVIADAARVVAVAEASPLIDNNTLGYAESGSWSGLDAFGSGYGSNYRYAASGDGTSTATWEFSGLSSGSYEVEVTWTAHANRASDAPYRVYEGTTLLGTTRLDQRSWPTGASVGGVSFQNLGRFRLSGTGALRVVLGNDADGYVIADAARVVAVAEASPLIDNNTLGYAESGSWSGLDAFGSGYGSNYRYAASGDGTSTATWEFSGLSSGSYEVEVTWTAHANRASDAPYRVYEGTTLLGTTRLDQRSWPTGASVGGVSFQGLGRFRLSGTGALRVVLGNDADGYVIADAVRIVPD